MNAISIWTGQALLLIVPTLCAPLSSAHASAAYSIANSEWKIAVTDRGYSDFLVENTQLYLREYLSGEWGGALKWADSPDGASIWFEPEFTFPVWATNSNFTSLPQSMASFDGGMTFTSTFDNGKLSVKQTLTMIDTAVLSGGPGVAQGTTPASAAGAGASVTSSRHVLKHSYEVMNISGAPLEDVSFFQFLHGLNATHGVYDNRNYGGALADYQHDITQWGTVRALVDMNADFDAPGRYLKPPEFFFDAGGTDADLQMLLGQDAEVIDQWFIDNLGFSSPSFAAYIAGAEVYQVNEDVIAFHSVVEPDHFEVGEYGNPTNSDHEVDKPPTGVHLSVESGLLNDLSDEKLPEGEWVGGAEQFDWGTMAADETRSIDFLLSISTTEHLTVVPLPSTLPLLGSALIGVGFARLRKRSGKGC